MRHLPLLLLLACTAGDDETGETGETGETDETGDTGPVGTSILAASGTRACALAEDAMRCWGDGAGVAVVDGVALDAETIAVSPSAACWVEPDGDVACTPTASETEPGTRLAGTGLYVAGGVDGFCAVVGNRSVSCWAEDDTAPVTVDGAVGAVRTVSRAGTRGWALNQANGVLQTWDWGQAVTTNEVVRGAEQVAPGVDHTCIRTTATQAQCWGSDALGQTGVDGTGTLADADRVDAIATGVRELVSGSHHLCALLDDDTVQCWGDNSHGQLGRGTVADPAFATTPAAVPGLADVLHIAAGDAFTCAALADGRVQCWGAGSDGQLGGDSDSATPVTVIGP